MTDTCEREPTLLKAGDLVRFNHERDGGPVHRVVSVAPDRMVELHDMGGYFAAHLFAFADDVAGIPGGPPADFFAPDENGWSEGDKPGA